MEKAAAEADQGSSDTGDEDSVKKHDEVCSNNDEFWIQTDEFWIQNDGKITLEQELRLRR